MHAAGNEKGQPTGRRKETKKDDSVEGLKAPSFTPSSVPHLRCVNQSGPGSAAHFSASQRA